MLLTIPVAWLQLAQQRVRFLATVGGIAFVVILLFMQIGFRDALFESSVRVHQSLQGDLFVISPQYKSLTSQQSFPRTRLYQTLGFDAVESVSPLYVQFGKLRNFQTGQKYPIYVFGVNPGKMTFTLSEVNQNLDSIKQPNKALFDRSARPEFGPIAEMFSQGKGVSVEVSPFNEITEARRLEISGLFSIGPSFGVDGNLIVNDSTFLNTFSERKADEIDIGIINLKAGSDLEKARASLTANLSDAVKILTRQEFIELEKSYWDVRTPAGFAFKVMVTMGFIIGIGVVYQILYSNISSHLIEFATLKAIGHTNSYLLNIVFQQALILAFFGYIPGLIVSLGVYDLTRNATRLPVIMTSNQVLLVLISVILMCVFSGMIAVEKLRSIDPADIF
jgi:putative ABC transport system permease protein